MVGYPVVGGQYTARCKSWQYMQCWRMSENFMGIIGNIEMKITMAMAMNIPWWVIYREVQFITIFATRTQWTASIESRSILSDKQYADIANVLQFLMVTSPSFHSGQDARTIFSIQTSHLVASAYITSRLESIQMPKQKKI